jgi:hypothetical protein
LIESVVAAVLKRKDGSVALLADALLAAVFLAADLAVFLAADLAVFLVVVVII